MRQILLIPGLVVGGLLVAGAVDRPAAVDNTAAWTFLPQSAETPAGSLLDLVIDRYSPARAQWLEMNVVQRMFEDNYQTEGRYLLGPDHRLRLEMTIRGAEVAGNLLAVSDGRDLYQARWSPGNPPKISKQPLPDGLPAARLSAARTQFLQECGFGGLVPLLTQIRRNLLNPRRQAGLCQERNVIKLSGDWKADEANLKNLPTHLRPRRGALYLDAETLWPYRIEWIGSPRPQDHLVLLLQMDFQGPVINRPLSQAESAQVFRFPFECRDALAADPTMTTAEEADCHE